ncbi:MAG TPA: AAA family ATPase [Candidatus Eremiobacteraceae bacterium]
MSGTVTPDIIPGVLPVRISLFGQPRVAAADDSREFPLPRKTLNVMAYLILHCGRHTARDSIAYALFPDDDEETARGHLRRNLSYLLSSLPQTPHEARFVLSEFDRIAWNPTAAADVDVFSFNRAVAEGRDGDALACYTGDLLPTLYDDWTNGERERLRDVYHDALARTIMRDRSLRRFDRAVESAHRLLDEDPWREDIVRQLIAIRYEAGDRAGALAEFERFAVRLHADMNVEPMPETLAIRDAILSGVRLASSESPARGPETQGAPSLTLPFAGRAIAMDSGLRLWHAAADGRAKVLFVAGQAGIGKSRFTTELARAIEREGGVVVRGETAAGGEHRPYEAFVEALRNAAPIRARSAPRDKNDVWQRMLDELLDEYARATFVDDRAARVRLFESVRRGLSDLARTRPATVILEDVHWAGAATIDLLEFVATRLGNEQVLIVVTFRSDELPTAHPLRALRRQLQSHGNASELELGPLDAVDANTAARTAVPDSVDDQMLKQAVTRSGGVPLLLHEALQDIVSGRQTNSGGIEEVFKSRLARLSSDAETALMYGAVIGARFDVTALAAATGWSDDQLVDALRESIELGLIRASARAPGLAFSFTHHLAYAAALEHLSAQELEVAHALVARALASLPQSHSARSAEIARHFQAARNAAKSAEYFLRAARYALDVFANEEARDTASAGLSLIDGSDPAQARLTYDLLAIRERAFARMGALAERRTDALSLRELSLGDAERSCSALERVFDAYRDDALMRRETLARLEVLASASERNAAIFDRMSATDAFLEHDFTTSRDAAFRASQAFERLGDPRAAFLAWAQYVNSLCRLGDYKHAAEQIANVRPAYEANEDVELRMEFHHVASTLLGELPEIALNDARQSLELALRVGDRFAEARGHQNAAVYLGKMGEFKTTLREHERALEAYRDVGDVAGVAASIVNLATVRGFCGDREGAEALFNELPDQTLEQPGIALRVIYTRAALAMRSGCMSEVENHLVEVRDLATRLKNELYIARVAALHGEFCARMGRDAEARTFLDEALTGLQRLEQRALTMETRALFARFSAGVGDFAAARAHAAQAIALAEGFQIQHFAEQAWHLAAAHVLLGESARAWHFAESAARAFVEGAMRMDADLAESYSRLPWHRHTIEYLSDRSVPIRLSDPE